MIRASAVPTRECTMAGWETDSLFDGDRMRGGRAGVSERARDAAFCMAADVFRVSGRDRLPEDERVSARVREGIFFA